MVVEASYGLKKELEKHRLYLGLYARFGLLSRKTLYSVSLKIIIENSYCYTESFTIILISSDLENRK